MTGGIPPYEPRPKRDLESPGVRWITFGVISALHLLIIGGAFLWGCSTVEKPPEKPKEKKYKVKLQAAPPPAPASEPTVAPPPPRPQPPKPVVTPPEPVVAPPPKPQPPKEPVVKPPPKKKPPKEPVVKPPKKKTPTKRVKKKPKKQPPPEPEVVVPPRKKVKNPPKQQTTQNIQKPPKKKEKPKDNGVYQPPTTGKKFDPKGKYSGSPTNRGSNPNARPSKQPGPGDDSDKNQKWHEQVIGDVKSCWSPPEGVFWGGGAPPQAVVELTIAADGRVLNARLVKSSGNARMDATIKEMLRVLTRVTRPPHGGQTIRVELIPE